MMEDGLLFSGDDSELDRRLISRLPAETAGNSETGECRNKNRRFVELTGKSATECDNGENSQTAAKTNHDLLRPEQVAATQRQLTDRVSIHGSQGEYQRQPRQRTAVVVVRT